MRIVPFTRKSTPTVDERRALVARILASSQFAKSARLREFLTFVTEQGIAQPDKPIHEPMIAAVVFGRQNAQGADDSIVRVHASQLRKRLESYFQLEGLGEELILEIPKGNYAPLYRARHVDPPPVDERTPARPFSRIGPPWMISALVVLLITTGGLVWQNLRLRAELPPPMSPEMGQFWAPFFRTNMQLDVVLADSNLALFQEMVRSNVSLEQYANRDFQKLVDSFPERAGLRNTLDMLIHRRYTSIGDANLARRLAMLGGTEADHVQFIHARDFQPVRFRTDNVILLGGKRSTPWVELLENQLNFRFNYEGVVATTVIHNGSPKQGEEPIYQADDKSNGNVPVGYCVIARVPCPSGKGKVLLLSGTEMEATEAGGLFLLAESSLIQLRQALALRDGEPFPDFEALLRTTRVGGSSPSARILNVRRH